MKNKIGLSSLLLVAIACFAFNSFNEKEDAPEIKITPMSVTDQDYENLTLDSTTNFVYATTRTKDDEGNTSVVRWENNRWNACGGKLVGYGRSMCFHIGKLYIGVVHFATKKFGVSSKFGQPAQGDATSTIYVYENGEWKKIGEDILGEVNVLSSFNGELYTGGDYAFEEDNEDYSILKHFVDGKWVDCKAKASSGTKTGNIKNACVYKGKLFVTGYFGIETSNGEAADIAIWDGNKWSSLGFVMYAGYNNMVVYHDELILGGSFLVNSKGFEAINNIYTWDGSQIKPLRDGLVSGPVHCFNVLDGKLYIGGEFKQEDKVRSRYLVMWDGTDWHPMLNDASPVGGNEGVYEMVGYGHTLIVAGVFKSLNGVVVKANKTSGIAKLEIIGK